ncbi:MAG: hypothetical protein ACI4OZ_01555 [Akkermansia sp.]
MIPIQQSAEPEDFEDKVRSKGNKWLRDHPDAKPSEYRPYWRKCAPQMEAAYGLYCAYSGMKRTSRELTIDHFVPKSVDKNLVYEWSNYRLCSYGMNNIKDRADHTKLADPFTLPRYTFALNLANGAISVRRDVISEEEAAKAAYTIEVLDLNEASLCNERRSYVTGASLEMIRDRAPFVAEEMEYQGIPPMTTEADMYNELQRAAKLG